jgi:hypothetical protein
MKKRDEKRLREIVDQLTDIRDELVAILGALDDKGTGYVVRVDGSPRCVTFWDAKVWKNRDTDDRDWGVIGHGVPYVFASRKDAQQCINAWHEVDDGMREEYVIEEYDPAPWNR